ncbi:MAG: PAS domain S-box protein, partial [Bacteroidota bacterium]
LDNNGIFTLVEGMGLEGMGLKPGQLVGQSVFDVYRDLSGLKEKFRGALTGQLTSSVDQLGERVFESRFSPIRTDDRDIVGVIGVATDITERVRAEEALRNSELKYRTLVEQMREGLMFVDNDDVVQFVNDRFCEMVGYTREELLGNVAMNVLLREEDRPLMQSRKQLQRHGISEQYEIQLRTKSGELIWSHVGGAPVLDARGVVVGSIGVHTDITSRKKAEEFLQESERRFRQLAEHVRGVVWILDQNKPEVLFVSPLYEEIWGRTRKSFYDNPGSFLEGIPASDRMKVERAIQEQLEGNTTELEYRVLRPDTSIRWVRTRSFPLKDRFGRVYRTIGITEDITGEKQLETALTTNQGLLNLLVSWIPVMVWTTDRELRVTSLYGAAMELFNVEPGQLVGKSLYELFDTTDREFPPIAAHLTALQGRMVESEERIGNGDYKVRVEPLRNKEGEIVGCVRMLFATSALSKEEEKRSLLASAFESTSDLICITDLDNHLRFANRAFLNAYGFELNELLNKPLSLFESPKNPPELSRQIFRETIRDGWQGEMYSRRKDGSELRVYLAISLVKDHQGRPIGLLRVARDITAQDAALEDIRGMVMQLEQRVLERTAEVFERKDELAHVNKQLGDLIDELKEAKRKAEEASKVKSQFLTHVNHELRTPLNSVIGFANVLLKNREKHLSSQDLSYLDKILANAKHLLSVINQMLDLSKIEAGRLELNFSTISLEGLIIETIAEMQSLVQSQAVAVSTDIPEDMQLLEADEQKLKQVLINLLANALKFTERGSVTARVVTDDHQRPVRIDVIDTGIGIPQEKLHAIFEPFGHVKASDSGEQPEGSGLGLTISRSLCQLMGFDLTVQSQLGKGSAFSIHLRPEAPAR